MRLIRGHTTPTPYTLCVSRSDYEMQWWTIKVENTREDLQHLMSKFDRMAKCPDKIEDLRLPFDDHIAKDTRVQKSQATTPALSTRSIAYRIKWVMKNPKELKKVVDGVKEMNETLSQVLFLSCATILTDSTIPKYRIINS